MRIHCDVCGAEIEREKAIVREIDEEPVYYCSPKCAEEAERADLVRGPGRDDDPTVPDPA